MILVTVTNGALHNKRSLAYGPLDWRMDVLATGRCQRCGGTPVFYGRASAECPHCHLWFDGLSAGCRITDLV